MNMETSPKEEAKRLVDRYKFVEIANYTSMHEVKQCALIAVDEILNLDYFSIEGREYWKQVKHEVSLL